MQNTLTLVWDEDRLEWSIDWTADDPQGESEAAMRLTTYQVTDLIRLGLLVDAEYDELIGSAVNRAYDRAAALRQVTRSA